MAETYGIMVYQEEVMQIAVELAGYSGAESDNMRRAIGKKRKGSQNTMNVLLRAVLNIVELNDSS